MEAAFKEAARAAHARKPPPPEPFVLPRKRSKRLVVLDRLAQEFEPGRRYREREVNRILRAHDDDTATLRRYLVNEGFLDRDHGEYWRSGGTVDLG